jgi:hypothetical protein
MTYPICKDVITVSSLKERSKSTYESFDAEMLSAWQLKFCMWHYHPVRARARVCVKRHFTNVFIYLPIYLSTYLSIYLHITNTWRKAPTTDNSSSASQEIPCTSSDQKTHNRVHKKPRKVLTQNQMNPVHNQPPYFLYIRFSDILPSTHTAPRFVFPPNPQTEFSPKRWTWSHLIKLLIMLYSYLPPAVSSFSVTNIFLGAPFSNTLSLCYYLNVRDQTSHPYKTTNTRIAMV